MSHQNLFILILLIFIIASFIGIMIVIKIIKNIQPIGTRFQNPSFPPYYTHRIEKSNNKNNNALFFFISMGIIIWVLFINTKKNEATFIPPPSYIEENKSYNPNISDNIAGTPHFISNNLNNHSIRINQSPSLNDEGDYVIQLAALTTHKSALKLENNFKQHRPIIIIDTDGLYKVLIITFLNRANAERYSKKYKLSGFIRQIENINT